MKNSLQLVFYCYYGLSENPIHENQYAVEGKNYGECFHKAQDKFLKKFKVFATKVEPIFEWRDPRIISKEKDTEKE
jgi:hypothetical protein